MGFQSVPPDALHASIQLATGAYLLITSVEAYATHVYQRIVTPAQPLEPVQHVLLVTLPDLLILAVFSAPT